MKKLLLISIFVFPTLPVFAQSSDRSGKGLGSALGALIFLGILALWRAYKANQSNRDNK